jgi:hypothetical protein
MHSSRWIGLAWLLGLLSTLALAGDVTGKWQGNMSDGSKTNFTLESEGTAMSGNMLDGTGKERPLTGKLGGDDISFHVTTEWQGQPVTLVGTGKVSEEQIQLHLASDNGYGSTDILLKRVAANQ